MKEIAPDAVINEDYDFLMELLSDIAAPEVSKTISDWACSGQVFHDFISVDLEVKKLLAERDEAELSYSIERLKPKITGLCARVSSLEVKSAKERLCQSEIAKKVAHLMRAILSLETGEREPGAGPSRILAQHLSQLPLPEDYALQELRTLTRNYMMEIIES